MGEMLFIALSIVIIIMIAVIAYAIYYFSKH